MADEDRDEQVSEALSELCHESLDEEVPRYMIGAQKGLFILDVARFAVEDQSGRFGLPLSDASIPTCAIGARTPRQKSGRAADQASEAA